MDAIVTARVPASIKEQGRVALNKIGATPTDLINAAYRYVLAKGELLDANDGIERLEPGTRRLSSAQQQALSSRLEKTTFNVPASFWENHTDEELLFQALEEKYASTDRHECSA